MSDTILRVDDIQKYYGNKGSLTKAVDHNLCRRTRYYNAAWRTALRFPWPKVGIYISGL